MKLTLTALTVAALLVPLSANAAEMTKEESESIMAIGEIIGERIAERSRFIVRYGGTIYECITRLSSHDGDSVMVRRHVRIECFSTEH